MATFLFDSIVFGPVNSRRLGVSLGINLLPNDSKICNFNCIYCECGWTKNNTHTNKEFHPRHNVYNALRDKLQEMQQNNQLPDVITFAGNGEPTMHPDFEGVIKDVVELRDKMAPGAKIAVLSNATMLHKQSVVEALKRVDQNILKIDSAFQETIELHNQPKGNYKLNKVVEQIKQFNSDFTLQTLFLKGSYEGKIIDNTTDKELNAWFSLVADLQPKEAMIYTIARDTPVETLEKVPLLKLEEIAERLRGMGIKVQVSG